MNPNSIRFTSVSTDLRNKAEELLKEKSSKTNLQLSEVEMQKLMHELQVHQIELELQNEELMLAKAQAEEASRKYTELYDFAPSGYFTLSKQGKIVDLNLCGAQMLGRERTQLKDSLFGFFVSDETKPVFNHFLGKVFAGKSKELCEIALLTNGCSPMFVQLAGIVTEYEDQCFITAIDITDHKKLEEARLESSEERYRILYENAKVGLYRTTPDGTILLANKALVKMLGYTSFDELAKVNVEKGGFETPNQRKAFLEKIEQTGEVENFESTWIRQDRTPVFVRESALAIRDTNGNSLYYDGTVEDITTRKQAKEALIESEEKYRALFETSLDGISLLDLSGKIIFANNQVVKLFGYNQPSEFIGLNGFGLIHPDDKPKMDLYFNEFFTTGVINNCEVRSVKKDGSEFIGEYSATIIKNANGDPIYMMDVVRDITERKRVEEALRESEARYRLLFEKSADGILIVDVETKTFKYANPALCQMLGYTEIELTTLGLSDIHPKHDLQRVIAEFESLTREEKTLASDIPCLRKDGTIIYTDINTTTTTMDGRLTAVGLFRDITERKRAEESLRQSEIKLQVIIESTADGILAIDGSGKVIKTNNRFAELWKIPQAVINSGDDATLLNFVLEQLISPKQFLDKVQQLYNSTDEDTDTLFFKDGRIFERYSAPLIQNDKVIGRVWSFRDITERKRAEEALRESKNIIQNIIDNSPSLIYILDLDGKFILANKKLAGVLNFPDEKLLGNTRELFMPKEFADQHRNHDLQIINSEQASVYEEEILESDGQHIYLTQKFPLFDLDGKMYAIGGISTDITERKQVEEAIFKLKEEYRLLVESAPDIIFTIASDGTFTSLSPAFETLLFWQPEEWIGKPFAGLIHPDDRPLLLDIFQQAMQGMVPSVFESRVLTKKGHYLFFEYVIKLVRENGEIKGVMGITRHITERKKAEEKINMLAHAVMNSADCIAITDKDYKIIFVNDSFSKVYGFEKEEIVGQPISVITSKNNLPEIGHSLYSAMVKKEVWNGEVLNKRKDGNDFPVQLSLAPVITDKGEMIAVVGVLRDITERRRAESELKLKNDQLLNLNAEKDKFFSIIAHDLRSPFNGFMGLTQLLTENTRDLTIDQILKISVSMRNSAANLFRLLENLLQWSRMQQGLIPFDPKVVKLLPLANECIEMHLASAKIKGIEITIDFPSDMEVLADSDMLQTVIRNLVSNAIKFTPIGGKINFLAKTGSDKTIEISISDTGIGMGQEMIGNLFRLDVQANRRGTEGEPSSGLGLLLCKEFIEKHGGKLWVESEEKNLPAGKAGGSTFYFTLP